MSKQKVISPNKEKCTPCFSSLLIQSCRFSHVFTHFSVLFFPLFYNHRYDYQKWQFQETPKSHKISKYQILLTPDEKWYAVSASPLPQNKNKTKLYTSHVCTVFVMSVTGSLAALVYQHSITPLALPCKLVLADVGRYICHMV